MLKEEVLNELQETDRPLGVTELAFRTIEEPDWDDREKVQEVLGDLMRDGAIGQTPDWKYVSS